MASHLLLYACLLLVISCSATLSVEKTPPMAVANELNDNPNTLSNWYNYYRLTNKRYSRLDQHFPSIPARNLQRRNVIMPRICYFSRVTKTGIHQKLCLPYNHDDKP